MPSHRFAELTVTEIERVTGGGGYEIHFPNGGGLLDTAGAHEKDVLAAYRRGGYDVRRVGWW
jgi:hypothetical protein